MSSGSRSSGSASNIPWGGNRIRRRTCSWWKGSARRTTSASAPVASASRTIIGPDALGFEEFWSGEHNSMVWNPHPSPDLLVVEGFRQTKHIRIGPGGFCLPYHHPAELANRIAMLDHLSGGRLNVGFAASGW